MFKNEYQGGPHLDVFSVQGKDPLSKLKITGPTSCVRKEFDNDIRTFILSLNGDTARSKISFPKGSKSSLHLTQPYLTFQIYLQSGQSFTLEIVLVTKSNSKLRLIFSTSNREITITAHHIKMPCSVVQLDTWLNLCIDMFELVSNYFDGNEFGYVDSITLSANCKLKRIFTLKDKPLHSLSIPKGVDFPSSVESKIQNLDYDCFTEANINIRSGTGNPNKRIPLNKSSNNENTHIAFGSRTANKNTDENASRSNASSARTKSGRNKTNLDESNQHNIALTSRAIDLQPLKVANKSTSKTSNENNNVDSKIKYQPKPPDKNTSKNVRKPRVVKSADVRSRALTRSDPTPNQTFSKSADSRNRRKPSATEIEPNVESKQLVLPNVKIKKGISRSAMDLEKMEQEIGEKRELHFKSQSLSVLPKIGSTRNDRYRKISSISDDPEADDVFNRTGDEAELMALAGENEVDDYLKNRTRSSCRDDESLSSCNSANSDLYTYSSRPRSVVRKQSDNGLVVSSRSHSRTNTNHDISNIHSKSNTDLRNSKQDKINTPSKPNNSTFTKDDDGEDVGVDLSWEYSESTSMLVIPKDLFKNNSEEQTDLGISLECDDRSSPEHENVDVEVGSKPLFIDDASKQSVGIDILRNDEKIEITTETEQFSSGIVSDVSSDNDNSNNNANIKNNLNINNDKNNNVLNSSFTMRDSCDSDTMSWLHNSQDATNLSVAMTNTLDKIKSPQIALRQRLKEQLGSLIVGSKDAESESDGLSECSDDTTYTDLPPKRFRNYRYQDEIKSISSTLDLSATIPATPSVGEQARLDENNNELGGKLDNTANEELLDLMFDPVLNCYYDPVTHKYYELN